MREWIINHPRSKILDFKIQSKWLDLEIGQPIGTVIYNSTELEDLGYVGIYKISNRVKYEFLLGDPPLGKIV